MKTGEDKDECEHIYGYGDTEYEGGWLEDDMDGWNIKELFTFCPRCGRCLKGDWERSDKEKSDETNKS